MFELVMLSILNSGRLERQRREPQQSPFVQ